jgi:hypothetical protein
LEIKNARGIDEAGTVKLLNALKKKAEELRGSPVLFELIQVNLTKRDRESERGRGERRNFP